MGLGIRIIGEVTAEKVRIVQDADYIYREEVDAAVEEYRKEHGEAPVDAKPVFRRAHQYAKRRCHG